MKSLKTLDNRGAALVSVLITLPFLLLIAFNYTKLGVNNLRLAQGDQYRTQTQFVADASLDYGMQQLNDNLSWVGTGGEVEFDNSNNVRTTYNLTVADVDDDTKTLTTTARLYKPASSVTALSTITIQTELRPVSAGDFSIVTGVGGLYMENSAKVLGGSVFVNGNISMKNTSQIGLQLSPVDLSVAHQICPLPSDPDYNTEYPRICNPGENGEPIVLQNSAKIYGTVRANNQTNGSGMLNPGLVASSGVSAQPLPTHDRTTLVNTINAADAANSPDAQTGAAAGCSSGTKTWPANLKINGDVSISNSCKVTVLGNVWITGKLTIRNSSELIVSNSLGTTRPDIMVDGSKVDISNSSILKSNSSGTGFQIINYWSKAPCSPSCTSVTGSYLADSRDEITIELNNSSQGPNTVFYSRWTEVSVGNSGQIGALVGQTVAIKNSGTITFGTTVGTGTEFWVLDGYRRVF